MLDAAMVSSSPATSSRKRAAAALVIAGFVVNEGIGAWHGGACTVPVAALTRELEIDERDHRP